MKITTHGILLLFPFSLPLDWVSSEHFMLPVFPVTESIPKQIFFTLVTSKTEQHVHSLYSNLCPVEWKGAVLSWSTNNHFKGRISFWTLVYFLPSYIRILEPERDPKPPFPLSIPGAPRCTRKNCFLPQEQNLMPSLPAQLLPGDMESRVHMTQKKLNKGFLLLLLLHARSSLPRLFAQS